MPDGRAVWAGCEDCRKKILSERIGTPDMVV